MAGLRQVGNVQLMQKINRNKVVNLIRRSGPIARPAIAQQTGLSMSSITNQGPIPYGTGTGQGGGY